MSYENEYVEGCWGFPYLKIKKFLGFLVSRILGFLVSEFLVFKDSPNPLMFVKDICSVLPNVHFMFLEDIDKIFKIFKMLLDGSSGFVGARLFQNFEMFDVQKDS